MLKTIFPQTGPFAPRKYGELQRVTERVWIYRNITNSSFVVGDRSVAVIDTQVNRPTAELVLAAVRSVTDKPIEFAVNTHYHWDHTNGNAVFKNEGAEVIASARTKDFMVSRSPRQKEFLSGRGFELGSDPYLPDRTFDGEHALDLGGTVLKLFFAGRAETDDATAIHVPSDNVVMAGDTVMTGSFPIFGQPVWDEGLQGDGQWEKTISVLTALKPAHILPGHGPLAHEKEIQTLLSIQKYFVDNVGSCVRRGLSAEDTLREMEPALPGWLTSIPVVWGNPRYAILRVWRGLTRRPSDAEPGWQSFKPSAIPAADPAKFAAVQARVSAAADHLSAAEEASEGGDKALGIAILKRGTERFPDSAGLWTAYAEALIETSRAEASVLEKGDFFFAARQAWERALSIDPVHAGALLGKGRYLVMMAYRGGEDPRAGMDILEKLIALSPAGRTRAEAEFYLGMGCRRLGDEGGAKSRFVKALQFDPAFMPARLAQ